MLNDYEVAVRRIAGQLAPSRQVDAESCDGDEYQARLRLRVSEARAVFHQRHGGGLGEKLYVYKSLWRAGRFWERRRRQTLRVKSQLYDIIDAQYEIEGQLEARDALQVLRAGLGAEGYDILERVALCGKMGTAYDPDRDGCGLRGFQRRVTRLRCRARELLS